MSQDLIEAVERLHVSSYIRGLEEDSPIDDILNKSHPRPKRSDTNEEIKARIEEDFLTPPTSFDPEWLDKLQQ